MEYRFWCKTFQYQLSSAAHARVHLAKAERSGVTQDRTEEASVKSNEGLKKTVPSSAVEVEASLQCLHEIALFTPASGGDDENSTKKATRIAEVSRECWVTCID